MLCVLLALMLALSLCWFVIHDNIAGSVQDIQYGPNML